MYDLKRRRKEREKMERRTRRMRREEETIGVEYNLPWE